jgi:hypothetical protein
MVLGRFQIITVLAGAVAITTLIVTRFAMTGTFPSAAVIVSALFACASAVLLLALFQGPPPQTIAEVLYDTEQGGLTTRDAAASVAETAR